MKAEIRTWRYHKDMPQGKIFEVGEEIPAGWVDSPSKIGQKAAPKRKRKAAPKKKAE